MLNNFFRIIFILMVSLNLGFAKDKGEEVSTKNDIKVLIELIKSNQEATNKRFDDVNKRFDDMQKQMDKRFEDVNKRFEAMDKRFEDIQKQMDKRFEAVDKRFEDMQKYMDKRFEFMQSLMFALLASIFGLIGYSIYDRKKVIKDSRDEFEKIVEEKLIVKADKKALDRVVSIIEELAKVDEKVKDILSKHNLAFKG